MNRWTWREFKRLMDEFKIGDSDLIDYIDVVGCENVRVIRADGMLRMMTTGRDMSHFEDWENGAVTENAVTVENLEHDSDN